MLKKIKTQQNEKAWMMFPIIDTAYIEVCTQQDIYKSNRIKNYKIYKILTYHFVVPLFTYQIYKIYTNQIAIK